MIYCWMDLKRKNRWSICRKLYAMQEKQVYDVSDIISVLLECGATKKPKRPEEERSVPVFMPDSSIWMPGFQRVRYGI